MKRILILVSSVAMINLANAQTGPTTFGFKAGVNFQNLTGHDVNGDQLNNRLKAGLSLGLNAQIPIATDFYVQPGVEFNQKGAKSSDNYYATTLNYIDVPVSLVYKPLMGTGHLVLGFGPYVGFGVGGHVSGGNTSTAVIFQNQITAADYNTGYAYFKRVDAGANLFAGYELNNNLSLQLNAQLGLTKTNPSIAGFPDDQSSVKNTGFGFTLGYRL
jgi:hypothetical protein